MNGYCSECDEQVEFNDGTVIYYVNVNEDIIVNLKCPWCKQEELITIIEL